MAVLKPMLKLALLPLLLAQWVGIFLTTYASEDGTNSVFTLNPALQKQLDALASQHPKVCQRNARGEAGGVTYQVRGAALAIQPVRAF